MPIVSIDVRDGDPTVQASGQHRGTVRVTFDDGRIVERNLRAPDFATWSARLAAAPAEIQADIEQSDAAIVVSPDAPIIPNGEASIEQTAIAYLRNSWSSKRAYDAYLLFERFNTYVTNSGYTWDNVQDHLIAAGLTQDEWDKMKAAYQYLSGGSRPAEMAAAETIQANWEAQH